MMKGVDNMAEQNEGYVTQGLQNYDVPTGNSMIPGSWGSWTGTSLLAPDIELSRLTGKYIILEVLARDGGGHCYNAGE